MSKAAVVAAPPSRRRKPKRAASTPSPDGIARWGEQYHLKAISRSLDVLECFGDETESLTLKEIGKRVDLPQSSLFRILLTLGSRGYLEQNSDGSYSLPAKLVYGKVHERAERLCILLRPHLQSLTARLGETSTLACLFGDQVRAIETSESFQEIRMTNKPGRVLPPHCSSLGKVITAFQEPSLVERILEVYGLFRRTEKTIVDRQVLFAEFAEIRVRGYAYDREETAVGGICVAAPVSADGKRVVAAISVSTPLVRMTREREMEITRAVVEAAQNAAPEVQRVVRGG
jgi:DNA-binding IclR family transcriptional regulator